MKHLFITFEGIEASGKSTQAGLLAGRLRSMGCDVLLTRDPGGTTVGRIVRDVAQFARGGAIYPETEALLFAAGHAQLAREVILRALLCGKTVISDRYYDSTIAYQGYGRGLNMKTLELIDQFAVGSVVPDITFLLDIDPRSALRRLARRARRGGGGQPADGVNQPDRLESEALEFHERIRAGYLEIAKACRHRIRIIRSDGGRETVARRIWAELKPILAERRAGTQGA